MGTLISLRYSGYREFSLTSVKYKGYRGIFLTSMKYQSYRKMVKDRPKDNIIEITIQGCYFRLHRHIDPLTLELLVLVIIVVQYRLMM